MKVVVALLAAVVAVAMGSFSVRQEGEFTAKYETLHGPVKDNTVNDELDLIFSRANVAKDRQNTLREQLGALEARQSLQKRFFDQLVVLGDLEDIDQHQDERIDLFEGELALLESFVDGALMDSLEEVFIQNDDNIFNHTDSLDILSYEEELDLEQAIEVTELLALAQTVPDFVDQALDNAVAVFNADLAVVTRRVVSVEESEKRRQCEVGEVTLTLEDRKAEYPFQTQFQVVPQVFYAVQGFDATLSPLSHAGYYPHPYAYPPPAALGFSVYVTATLDTLTVKVDGLVDFGREKLQAVTVSFQACSIGPGLGPVDHTVV